MLIVRTEMEENVFEVEYQYRTEIAMISDFWWENYTEYDCSYTSLKNSVSINFSRVSTTFRGRHSVYEQKRSSNPNYVSTTVKTVFGE